MSDWNRVLLVRLAGGAVALVAAYTLLACMTIVPHAPWTAGLGGAGQWLVGALSAAFGIAASWLAMGGSAPELGSRRSSQESGGTDSPHIVRAGEDGVVVLERRSIDAIAQGAAEHTPGVLAADVRVTPFGATALWIAADVTVAAGQPIKETSQRLRDELRSAVEELAGLEVQHIAVVARVSGDVLSTSRRVRPPPSRR